MQAQFSQMRPVAMAPSVGPRLPMFPPGVPGVGQQLFYGQPPPAFINPQVHAHFMMYMLLGVFFFSNIVIMMYYMISLVCASGFLAILL